MTLVTQTMSETSSDSGSSPSVSSVRMTASWPSQVSGVTITHTQERVHAHWPVVDRAFTAWLGCGWALTLVIPLVWPRGCTEIHRLWAVSVPGWSCPHTRAPLVTADHSHPVCDGPQHTHTPVILSRQKFLTTWSCDFGKVPTLISEILSSNSLLTNKWNVFGC